MKPGQKGVTRSGEEISQLKSAWAASGKSKTDFARENEINYMTFIGWFSQKEKRAKSKSGFVPLEVNPGTNHSSIFAEIDLGKGRRIVFHQPVGALQTLPQNGNEIPD